MKLNLRNEGTKTLERDDYREVTTYTIAAENEAPLYQIKKLDVYTDSSKKELRWSNFSITKDNAVEYLPQIYYRDDMMGEREPAFEIQTTSYGSLPIEEIDAMIAKLQYAQEAVKLFTKEFLA